jgi:hypothetical protein
MKRNALHLAFEADIDVRTAEKALTVGPEKIRGRAGERAAEAMKRLGLDRHSEPPPAA